MPPDALSFRNSHRRMGTFAVAVIAAMYCSFVNHAGAQTAPVITLTNGPPNIAYASPGSCTTSTCTWIQAGISGEAVSDVYLDMVPMSQNYTGTFTLSGPNASNYSISTSSDGTRNVGHITTASTLSAGDDSITVSANGEFAAAHRPQGHRHKRVVFKWDRDQVRS